MFIIVVVFFFFFGVVLKKNAVEFLLTQYDIFPGLLDFYVNLCKKQTANNPCIGHVSIFYQPPPTLNFLFLQAGNRVSSMVTYCNFFLAPGKGTACILYLKRRMLLILSQVSLILVMFKFVFFFFILPGHTQ